MLICQRMIEQLSLHHLQLLQVKLDYFVQDKLKHGGKYISYKGTVDKIDEHEKKLRLSKGTWIRIEDIFDIKLV